VAKIKKRKLYWKASTSSQVVGYKLYWSENKVIDYDSNCEMLGNVTEIILPDGVASFKPKAGPITFGVTAVDELGNESDMIRLAAPYQFNVPEAPDDLHMQTINDYYTSNLQQGKSNNNKEVNCDEPVEAMKYGNRFDSEKNNEALDFSQKFNLILEQAQKM
jgi:hypothetical protein